MVAWSTGTWTSFAPRLQQRAAEERQQTAAGCAPEQLPRYCERGGRFAGAWRAIEEQVWQLRPTEQHTCKRIGTWQPGHTRHQLGVLDRAGALRLPFAVQLCLPRSIECTAGKVSSDNARAWRLSTAGHNRLCTCAGTL